MYSYDHSDNFTIDVTILLLHANIHINLSLLCIELLRRLLHYHSDFRGIIIICTSYMVLMTLMYVYLLANILVYIVYLPLCFLQHGKGK